MRIFRWLGLSLLALVLAVGIFAAFYAFLIGPVASQDWQPDNTMRLEFHPQGHPDSCGGKSPEPLREAYQAAGRCKTDADCVQVESMCPLGCNLSVNKAHLDDYYAALREFRHNNCVVCLYRCFLGGDTPYCQDGQCKVPRARGPIPITRPPDPSYTG